MWPSQPTSPSPESEFTSGWSSRSTNRGTLEIKKSDDKEPKSVRLGKEGTARVFEWPLGDQRSVAVLSPTFTLTILTLKAGTWDTVHRQEGVTHFCWGPTPRNAIAITADHRLELVEWTV